MSKLKLEGELSLDGSGWERTVTRAQASTSKLAGSASGELKNALAKAFAVGVAAEAIRRTIEYTARIKDLSEQSGLTMEEVQRLGYAAESTGLQFEDFQTAISKLGAARKDAAEKNDELLTMLEKYGVTLRDLQNPSLRNIDLLKKMSAAIRGMNLTAAERQELRELFGKSGDKLATALATLDNFKNSRIISDPDIEAIDKLDKAVAKLKKTAMAGIAPPIAAIAKAVTGEASEDKKNGLKEYFAWLVRPFANAGNAGDVWFDPKRPRSIDAAALKPKVATPAGATATATGPGKDLFIDQRKAELAQLQADLNELASKNAFNLLGADEKRVELQKEINRLLADANALQSVSPKAATLLRIEREKKIGELQGINKPGTGGGPRSDSLTSVGNLLGAGTTTIPSIYQKMVDATQKSTMSIDELNTTMQNFGQLFRSIVGTNPFGSGGPN